MEHIFQKEYEFVWKEEHFYSGTNGKEHTHDFTSRAGGGR